VIRRTLRRCDFLSTLALALGVCVLPVPAATDEGKSGVDPEQVMRRAFANYFQYAYVQRMHLRVKSDSGQVIERTLDIAHERSEGLSRWLILFRAPPYMRGTALLSLEQRGRDPDQFLFTPEFGRVRRISGAQRSDRVAATDFSYEDLDPREPEDYELEVLGKGHVEGQACLRVRGRPLYDSRYRTLEWCVDRGLDVILKQRVYDRRRKLWKILRIDRDSLDRVGQLSIVHRFRMRDVQRGSVTFVELERVQVKPDFPEGTFTEAHLARGPRLPGLDGP